MLTPYRRHRAGCKHRSRRYKGCSCPIWIQGVLNGESVRRSLDLTNWEAAVKRVRELELHGQVMLVSDCVDRFLDDRGSMKLSDAMMRKYQHVADELKAEFGSRPVRSVKVDDVRRLREEWKLAAITNQKRLEMVRKFFQFCVDSEWLDRNPAKAVKSAPAKYDPTLPFTAEEMEKILWAAESIREAHPKIPKETPKKLFALILLMRYSGLRISDACMFRRSQLTENRVFLRQRKTQENVWVPVPPEVVKALKACDEGNEYYFYWMIGKPKSYITEWQQRLKLVYDMAGVKDGHSHRLRDTFSVDLLSKGVALDVVSKLLGHVSIKTTEKHYAPWVKARQDALEEAVKATWHPRALESES